LIIEKAALIWLESLDWVFNYGPGMAPGELAAMAQAYLVELRLFHRQQAVA